MSNPPSTNTPRTAVRGALIRIVASGTPQRKGEETSVSGPVTIGRDAACDLMLDDQSVSRRHARVERVEGGLRVVDLGSGNGVWMGPERIAIASWPPATIPGRVNDFQLRRPTTNTAPAHNDAKRMSPPFRCRRSPRLSRHEWTPSCSGWSKAVQASWRDRARASDRRDARPGGGMRSRVRRAGRVAGPRATGDHARGRRPDRPGQLGRHLGRQQKDRADGHPQARRSVPARRPAC